MNGHGGIYKAPTKEERRKQKAKRRADLATADLATVDLATTFQQQKQQLS